MSIIYTTDESYSPISVDYTPAPGGLAPKAGAFNVDVDTDNRSMTLAAALSADKSFFDADAQTAVKTMLPTVENSLWGGLTLGGVRDDLFSGGNLTAFSKGLTELNSYISTNDAAREGVNISLGMMESGADAGSLIGTLATLSDYAGTMGDSKLKTKVDTLYNVATGVATGPEDAFVTEEWMAKLGVLHNPEAAKKIVAPAGKSSFGYGGGSAHEDRLNQIAQLGTEGGVWDNGEGVIQAIKSVSGSIARPSGTYSLSSTVGRGSYYPTASTVPTSAPTELEAIMNASSAEEMASEIEKLIKSGKPIGTKLEDELTRLNVKLRPSLADAETTERMTMVREGSQLARSLVVAAKESIDVVDAVYEDYTDMKQSLENDLNMSGLFKVKASLEPTVGQPGDFRLNVKAEFDADTMSKLAAGLTEEASATLEKTAVKFMQQYNDVLSNMQVINMPGSGLAINNKSDIRALRDAVADFRGTIARDWGKYAADQIMSSAPVEITVNNGDIIYRDKRLDKADELEAMLAANSGLMSSEKANMIQGYIDQSTLGEVTPTEKKIVSLVQQLALTDNPVEKQDLQAQYDTAIGTLKSERQDMASEALHMQRAVSQIARGYADSAVLDLTRPDEEFKNILDAQAINNADMNGQVDTWYKQAAGATDAEVDELKALATKSLFATGDERDNYERQINAKRRNIQSRMNRAMARIEKTADSVVSSTMFGDVYGNGRRDTKWSAVIASLFTTLYPVLDKMFLEEERLDRASDRALDKLKAEYDARATYVERINGVTTSSSGSDSGSGVTYSAYKTSF